MDMQTELQRSKSEFVVYQPGSFDGSTFDTGNEHFLVFEGPENALMAVWTQSSYEGAGDHRIVFARSDDDGRTWSAPKFLMGCPEPEVGLQASWGFPLVSKSGRVYVLANQFTGKVDYHHQMTGTMDAVYSDDVGRTWSEQQTIPMPKSPLDHPDPEMPSNWIVWQRPDRLSNGKYYVGFTRWVSPRVRMKIEGNWTTHESVVEFMRFENVDEDPEPRDMVISHHAWGPRALRVPHYREPMCSIAQEPSIVLLPDGRLFCTMRTMSGYIWYTVSEDAGGTWHAPRPLLRRDFDRPILEPLCCCPIYQLADGRYVLLHHNNNGCFEGCTPEDTMRNRRPAFIALGEFRPDAEQPVWFSESKQLMDNDDSRIGPLKRSCIGVYPSFTTRNGENVLWHPERKFFLLGKCITDEFLADLSVPESLD